MFNSPQRVRTHRRIRPTRRAFTLLEVIVVVTIIALLATLIAPRLLGNIGKAKVSKAKAEVAELAKLTSIWMADNGYSTLPDDFELDILATGDDRVINLDDLTDPWERPYVLINPGEINPDFDIISYGADGEPGGDDENEDIVN